MIEFQSILKEELQSFLTIEKRTNFCPIQKNKGIFPTSVVFKPGLRFILRRAGLWQLLQTGSGSHEV
jgi:hypothetical protein